MQSTLTREEIPGGRSALRPGAIACARGFTLIELLIVVFVIATLAAMALPSMLRARMSANEASAVASVRTVNSAQASYSAAVGGGAYAGSLAVLASPCPASTSGFLPPDLSLDPSTKSGYTIQLQPASGAGPGPNDCNGTATVVGYYTTAVPVSVGLTGRRAFASTLAGTIYVDLSGVAPTEADMAPGGAGSVLQ